jgi:hypothetical protein
MCEPDSSPWSVWVISSYAYIRFLKFSIDFNKSTGKYRHDQRNLQYSRNIVPYFSMVQYFNSPDNQDQKSARQHSQIYYSSTKTFLPLEPRDKRTKSPKKRNKSFTNGSLVAVSASVPSSTPYCLDLESWVWEKVALCMEYWLLRYITSWITLSQARYLDFAESESFWCLPCVLSN